MTTTVATKTAGTVVLTHQAITAATASVVKGTAQDVSTALACSISLFHAMVEAVANTTPGTFIVQTSHKSSGDDAWVPRYKVTVNNGTPDTEALSGTEAIGQTVLEVASTTGFAAGDLVYVQDTGTLANSEWGELAQVVAATSLTLIDGLTTAKDSSDIVWNDAEIFTPSFDLAGVERIRVIYRHLGGTNVHVQALMTILDSLSTT